LSSQDVTSAVHGNPFAEAAALYDLGVKDGLCLTLIASMEGCNMVIFGYGRKGYVGLRLNSTRCCRFIEGKHPIEWYADS